MPRPMLRFIVTLGMSPLCLLDPDLWKGYTKVDEEGEQSLRLELCGMRFQGASPGYAYADIESAADGDHGPVERLCQLGWVAHACMLGMLTAHSCSNELQELGICCWLAIRACTERGNGTEACSHRIAKADFRIAKEADLWMKEHRYKWKSVSCERTASGAGWRRETDLP